jgi:GTP cyclohydrolase I
MQQAIKRILRIHKLNNPNFDGTPERVERMWKEFFAVQEPNLTVFPTACNEMLIIKNHIVWGFCPHHLLPVKYTFRIGYVPRGVVLGLSKLPELANYYITFLPLQEDLPRLICDALEETLKPQGIGCSVDGMHLCMVMRGIKSPCVEATVTKLKGIILLNPSTHDEFFR